MRIRSILGLLAAGVAVALACGDGLQPEDVLDTWYLQAYNDSTIPGPAIFRSGTDSSVVVIDSVRLRLNDDLACDWLVDLADEPPSGAETCAWSTDAGEDDILVTVNEAFELRGDANPDTLSLRDPNGNLLVFGREPAIEEPVDPGEPAARRAR